jgi:magnesium transporter
MRSFAPAAAGAAPLWIDLQDPSEEERAQVGERFKIHIPTRDELSEIESSSRLFSREGLVCVSMPLIPPPHSDDLAPPPLGFVLTPSILVTIRFSEIHGLEQVATLFKTNPAQSSVEAFVAIVEAMVDFGADMLERFSKEVAAISRLSFSQYAKAARGPKSGKTLRGMLVAVGTVGEHLSEVRDTLLGLQRIASFVSETAHSWLGADAYARLQTVIRDLQSLSDFETHLSDKVQFLLDAVLGFINTEQNEIFKVLTIASVVGIPPTLIASMYGMNFKNMPELSWSWGYQWGLLLILISTVLPILWFKSRGWW